MAHQAATIKHKKRTGGSPNIWGSSVVPLVVVADMDDIPSQSKILLTTDTQKDALPAPHRLAKVSTIGFASYLASFESPLHKLSRTGLAMARLTTRVHSSSIRNKIRFGGCPLLVRCHHAKPNTPNNRMTGINAKLPLDPNRWAIIAPTPLACMAKTAIELAILMFAKNAVSAVTDVVEFPSSFRFATNSAR